MKVYIVRDVATDRDILGVFSTKEKAIIAMRKDYVEYWMNEYGDIEDEKILREDLEEIKNTGELIDFYWCVEKEVDEML